MEKQIAHLEEDEKNALRILTGRLKQEYDIEQIILFGSKSRGDHSKYSDVDLLVLTKNKLDAKGTIESVYGMSSGANSQMRYHRKCLWYVIRCELPNEVL